MGHVDAVLFCPAFANPEIDGTATTHHVVEIMHRTTVLSGQSPHHALNHFSMGVVVALVLAVIVGHPNKGCMGVHLLYPSNQAIVMLFIGDGIKMPNPLVGIIDAQITKSGGNAWS